jgi:exportin-1
MTPRIPLILDATFEPTLGMITNDFCEFPEHRAGFYHMLRAINVNCFAGITSNNIHTLILICVLQPC